MAPLDRRLGAARAAGRRQRSCSRCSPPSASWAARAAGRRRTHFGRANGRHRAAAAGQVPTGRSCGHAHHDRLTASLAAIPAPKGRDCLRSQQASDQIRPESDIGRPLDDTTARRRGATPCSSASAARSAGQRVQGSSEHQRAVYADDEGAFPRLPAGTGEAVDCYSPWTCTALAWSWRPPAARPT
jgi:hypothetical protein